ncbi:hypothetical protein [Horticoccus sp. 23ND18S-11]|uniref:hypothetical protein n=1 Tax=Horticoccus sp. 23ND18S-11 TaxID=3391832 RepID=UPI0039C9F268
MTNAFELNEESPSGPEPSLTSLGLQFALCRVARASGPDVHHVPLPGDAPALALQFPALLENTDLTRVTAVTRTIWSTSRGRVRTSSLVLSVRPEAMARFQAALQPVLNHDDQVALVLHGEVIGVLTLPAPVSGDEVSIDGAALLAPGEEVDPVGQTRNRARQINATLS